MSHPLATRGLVGTVTRGSSTTCEVQVFASAEKSLTSNVYEAESRIARPRSVGVLVESHYYHHTPSHRWGSRAPALRTGAASPTQHLAHGKAIGRLQRA